MVLAGCGSIIASFDLQGSRHRLSEEITTTSEEQLVLALVKTRFVHNPGSLDVSAINTQLSWSAGIGGSYRPDASSAVSPSLGYSESPTITYIPLQGKEFVSRYMTPVKLGTLALLIETSWSGVAALRLIVKRINNIPNGFDGSIEDSQTLPDYHKFNRVAQLFGDLLGRGNIFLSLVPENHPVLTSRHWTERDNKLRPDEILKETWALQDNTVMLNIRHEFPKKVDSENKLREFLDLLGVSQKDLKARKKFHEGLDSILLQNAMHLAYKSDILLQTRSLQEILYVLSWAVKVPPGVEQKGIVNVIEESDGTPFNLDEMFKGLLTIHWSSSEPSDAAIVVPYQNEWYYVRANDIPSKRTIVLLTQLTKMLSGLGSGGGKAPTLTLPL